MRATRRRDGLRANGGRDVPRRRRHARATRSHRGASRGRRAAGPFRGGGDRGDEAFRDRPPGCRLFRPEGLSAAPGGPDDEPRPAARGARRRLPDRARRGRSRDELTEPLSLGGRSPRRACAIARAARRERGLVARRARPGEAARPRPARHGGSRDCAGICVDGRPAVAGRARAPLRARGHLACGTSRPGAAHRQRAPRYLARGSRVTTIAEEAMAVPAEPAVEELSLKEGRGQALLGTITAAHFSHHVTNSLLNPLLPLIRDSFALSYGESGFAVSAFSIAAGLANAPWGMLADRIGSRVVIVGGLFLMGAASVALATAGSYWQLLALLVLLGIVSGSYHGPAAALIARIFSPRVRGTAMGIHITGGHLSFFAAPAVAGLLATATGTWRTPCTPSRPCRTKLFS